MLLYHRSLVITMPDWKCYINVALNVSKGVILVDKRIFIHAIFSYHFILECLKNLLLIFYGNLFKGVHTQTNFIFSVVHLWCWKTDPKAFQWWHFEEVSSFNSFISFHFVFTFSRCFTGKNVIGVIAAFS